ncbi:MAG: hypothetical protein IJ153_06095 [Clostridia bacterium]|nr:hypothetical protein [Clostridia bacterium]
MGTKKNYGVNNQLERIANALEAQTGSVSAAVLDAAFSGSIDGTNTTALFRRWWRLACDLITRNEGEIDRYALLTRWFTLIGEAWGDKIYTLRGPDYRVSNGNTALTPMADLAGKEAAPLCTEVSANEFHWMDEDPMYWWVRFNGISKADGTMDIKAVEGIDDEFDITGNLAPVYTGSIGLWHIRFTDGSYEYHTWATRQGGGMHPYESDVAPDGTHRAMHWEATFGGSLTKDGKLTSGSGYGSGWERNENTPNWRRAATTGIADARKWGSYEGLYSDTERCHLLDEWQFRHYNLENSGILEGCTGYTTQCVVAVAEENAKRVVVTTANGANFLVGSCIEVGTHGDGVNTDRNTAGNYDIIGCATIISIENVTIDGTAYSALNLDIATGVNIPATAYVSTMPWVPGSTERLPGRKDGSLYNVTNGKTPARIGGIEVIDGAYAIGLDPLWNSDWNADRDPKSIYSVYVVRDATKQGGSISASHTLVGTFTGPNSGWQYPRHFQTRKDDMLMPEGFPGSGSTYLKSAFSFYGGSGVRAPWLFARLGLGAPAGLACAGGSSAPSAASWDGRPRLSGSGKTRGEWAA